MAPIPIYSQSPITAAKPTGVTPQTADTSSSDHKSAPSTTSAQHASYYPPAQPGAPAMPAPTGSATSSRYAPVQPAPTQTIPLPENPYANGGPPLPQPGAFPQAPPSTTAKTASHLPPPPKAGEKYQPPTTAYPTPAQANMPPPTVPYSQRGTSTRTSYSAPGATSQPTPISLGSQSTYSGGPPGYQQNVNAAELDSQGRAAQSAAERDSSESFGGSGIASGFAGMLNGVGLGRRPSGNSSGSIFGEDTGGNMVEGMWDSASKFASQAGRKLSEVEGEVWKMINKS